MGILKSLSLFEQSIDLLFLCYFCYIPGWMEVAEFRAGQCLLNVICRVQIIIYSYSLLVCLCLSFMVLKLSHPGYVVFWERMSHLTHCIHVLQLCLHAFLCCLVQLNNLWVVVPCFGFYVLCEVICYAVI